MNIGHAASLSDLPVRFAPASPTADEPLAMPSALGIGLYNFYIKPSFARYVTQFLLSVWAVMDFFS